MDPDPAPKWVLVAGASSHLDKSEIDATKAIGTMLARQGYGLIVGDWPGVDEIVKQSFCEAIAPADRPRRIMHIDNHRRLFGAHERIGEVLPDDGADPDYSQSAIDRADAGIVISGRKGSRPAMDAMLRLGKPVLPVAFLGNDSFELFRDVLERWHERPVPGLTQEQFLQLVIPWQVDPAPVARLLRAALIERPQIFLSYRRIDSAAATGRLFEALSFHHGQRAVFIDYHGLDPGAQLDRILETVARAQIVVAVIGPSWSTDQALFRPDNWVRRELETAAEAGIYVIPVLLGETQLPAEADLPPSLQFLRSANACQVTLDRWQHDVARLCEAMTKQLGAAR